MTIGLEVSFLRQYFSEAKTPKLIRLKTKKMDNNLNNFIIILSKIFWGRFFSIINICISKNT